MREPKNHPIRLVGVRQNNLKNVSVEFPARKFTVVTGLSGSGKSSLAFDTLYAEGQRRYIESLSTYTRQFLEKLSKPDLDHIENIPPAIALEQRNTVINSRSTVGTQTEVLDYLRLLFEKLGKMNCLKCGGTVENITQEIILQNNLSWLSGKKILICAPLLFETKKAPKKHLLHIIQLLKEQGFLRIARIPAKGSHEVFALDEITPQTVKDLPDEAFTKSQLYIVSDRLKVSNSEETTIRLTEAIGQALSIGRGQVLFLDIDSSETKHAQRHHACVQCNTPYPRPTQQLFSFNNPLGACPTCSGFGFTLELDENKVVPDFGRTLKNGAIDPFSKPSMTDWERDLFRFAERHGISIGKKYRELTARQRALLWDGDPADDTFPGIRKCFEFLAKKKYKLHVRVFIRRYQSTELCPTCKGSRLKPEALAVKIHEKNIAEVLNLSIEAAEEWFKAIPFKTSEKKVAREILSQVDRRLSYLNKVGVGYLTLSRLAKTLSGGEFQRINLATQLGNGLCGTLYVLDEPSIGLHASDTDRLIRVLEDLKEQGNTVVCVEHDLEIMKRADWLVELGPGSGRRGGEIIATGTSHELAATAGSITGKYLKGDFTLDNRVRFRRPSEQSIRITGCRENNLKNIDVEFPLERFVVVTGVSGSGKSTLVHKTLYRALAKIFNQRKGLLTPENSEPCGQFEYLYGADQIRDVVLLDQKPIGKSSRSNPATYLKAWDEVRRIYANQVMSIRRGYSPQHFSFNVDGGRCPVCKGEGEITLDMHFMAEVTLPCEECDGKRFRKPILEIEYRGKNVHELLEATIDEAFDLFRDHPVLVKKFGLLRDVGLGYLQVGQSGSTLSGGESQRLKIASVLDEKAQNRILYLFDEPTTGLHQEDIKKLMLVLQDLVEDKNSIVMIEHHLDVIRMADWVIDLGPGGGEKGGHLVAAGAPWEIAKQGTSPTGEWLKKSFKDIPAPPREVAIFGELK